MKTQRSWAEESLCLHFRRIALRVFVSLCMIVFGLSSFRLRLRLAEELTFNSYFYVNSTNLIYGNSWGIPGNSLYLKHIIAM